MHGTAFDLAAFLHRYRELVTAVARLARSVDSAPPLLVSDLAREPFAIPGFMRGLGDSRELGRQLSALEGEVPRDLVDAVTRELRATIERTVMDAYGIRSANGGESASRGVSGGGRSSDGPPPSARAKPPGRGAGGGGGKRDRVLGVNPQAQPAPAAAAPPRAAAHAAPPEKPAEPPERRFMNAAIANHPAGKPLVVAKEYLLEVWVALDEQGDAAIEVPNANITHGSNEDVIELTIQVASDDFTVAQDAMPLKLPRRGPSAGKARFDVVPLHAGRGKLTIGVYKEGNFLLQMTVEYSLGDGRAKPVTVERKGRALGAAAELQRRELGMTIEPVTNGYRCWVRGATATRVTLQVTKEQVGDMVTTARKAMLRVVDLRDDDRELVFQDGYEIDPASEQKALRILAEAGATLFQRLFFGADPVANVKKLGEKLRELATRPGPPMSFQFTVDKFPIPWGLLYFGDAGENAKLDWDLFLGMRHVVEQIPLQADMLVDGTTIASDSPSLAVSVNFNTGIDAQYELEVVKQQLAFWRELAQKAGDRMKIVEGLTREKILGAFRKPAGDQLTYFYCHAETALPDAPDGIDGSCLVFANEERLTLGEMNLNAPMTSAFPGNPLVFINACQSAQLWPEFYDGFIPYFMAKGARGVIGTECNTPAIFATEWALRFFPRFFDGEPLGDLFLDLRREFREKHHNPLGLLYNVYCDGDTQVRPSLTL